MTCRLTPYGLMVLQTVEDLGQTPSTKQIAESLGKPENRAYSALRRLHRGGLLSRPSACSWAVSAKGTAALRGDRPDVQAIIAQAIRTQPRWVFDLGR